MIVLLWDLDGTIQDSETLAKEGTYHGFRQILGRDPTESELEQLRGRPVPLVYKEWFDDELAGRILEVGTRFYQERSHRILCYPEVPEVLRELKSKGYKQGIVSSKRRFHVIREITAKGLDVFFSTIIAQEDTMKHKPSPVPLLLAADQLRVSPKDCIYIGDQPTDIEAGKAAGMTTIGALWGDGQIKRLNMACPSMLAYTPKDILNRF